MDFGNVNQIMQIIKVLRGCIVAMHWRYKTLNNPKLRHSSFVLGPLAAALQTRLDLVIVVSVCHWTSGCFNSSLALLLHCKGLECCKIVACLCKIRHCWAWFDWVTVLLLSAPASATEPSSMHALYSLLAMC